MIVATIDIGSTWTKGATFTVYGDKVKLQKRAARPTTVTNLGDAFFQVLDDITSGDPLEQIRSGALKLHYSSSAKGGLAVAAIGLVPDVTLEIGKVAAQSAGAKLTQVFAYRLTRQDIAKLEKTPPDILLFAGGTDGGNTDYVLANARAIADSDIDCDIVYAGNRAIADEVAAILAKKRLQVVANLLPDFNEPNPDPARDAIRTIFLNTIVKGKGLDTIMWQTGSEPLPTPLAVLEYTRAIHQYVPGWDDFLMFDMGGATTDVYSAHRERPLPGVVRRGLPEPEVKRTVEGDLGMRVSAQSVCRLGTSALAQVLTAMEIDMSFLSDYADRLTVQTDYLPHDYADQRLDTIMAGLCIGHAAARHVGRMAPVYTLEGEMKVQMGRNLSKVTKVVGSGGWLAQEADFDPKDWFLDHIVDSRGRTALLPSQFDYYRDEHYVFPLLANLAREVPQAAAQAGVDLLIKQTLRSAYAVA